MDQARCIQNQCCIQINRVVRRYHGNTGKRSVAQDEFLEHGNRFFPEFTTPKSITGFEEQSIYVGVGLMCKQFTDEWHTNALQSEGQTDYSLTVPPSMTPEKQLVYEVFKLYRKQVSMSIFKNLCD